MEMEILNVYQIENIQEFGSYSYAQNELYKNSLKAFFKLKKGLLSLNPNIRTIMHVFDHTIKPILLYGSDIWGMFNPFNMKCKKENPSFDNIYSGSLSHYVNGVPCKMLLRVAVYCYFFFLCSTWQMQFTQQTKQVSYHVTQFHPITVNHICFRYISCHIDNKKSI